MECETGKDAWEKLGKSYAGDDKLKVKLQTFRRKYELLQMNDQETMAGYHGRLVTLTNQMHNNCETVMDQMKV